MKKRICISKKIKKLICVSLAVCTVAVFSFLPVNTVEAVSLFQNIRVGLKFSGTCVSRVETSSDTGGTIGFSVKSNTDYKYTYYQLTTFAPGEVITASKDTGYHLQLGGEYASYAQAVNAINVIKAKAGDAQLPELFPVYVNSWRVCCSYYQSYPEKGTTVSENGTDDYTILENAVIEAQATPTPTPTPTPTFPPTPTPTPEFSPETTQDPEVTEDPEQTQDPEVTEDPEQTQEPEVTEEPEQTQEPTPSPTPTPTPSPTPTFPPTPSPTPTFPPTPEPTPTPDTGGELSWGISVLASSENAVKIKRADGTTVYVMSDETNTNWCRIVPGSPSAGSSVPALLRYGKARYRGCFDIKRIGGSDLVLVNELDVEDYLYGVIPNELSPGWTEKLQQERYEAVKAQCIAARTYAYKMIEGNAKNDYWGKHVDDTTETQVYSGYTKSTGEPGEYEASNRVVDETRGEILIYDHWIAYQTFYHSNSGGYLEKISNVWSGSDVEYAQSKLDPFSPATLSYVDYTGKTMSERIRQYVLEAKNTDIGEVEYINVIDRAESGRMTEVMIEGTQSDVVITKSATRTMFQARGQNMYLEIHDEIEILESETGNTERLSDRAKMILEGTYFTEKFVDDQYGVLGADGYVYERIKVYPSSTQQSIQVTTVGSGHGIGMSQAGAIAMSAEGYTYREILEFYYPGLTIGKII